MKSKTIKIFLINSQCTKIISNFVKEAEDASYVVQQSILNAFDILEELEEAMKLNDIVVTVGALEEVCEAASCIFIEPLVRNNILPIPFPEHFKIESSSILYAHGLFIIINEIGFNYLLEIIRNENKEIEFTKIVNVATNDYLKNYITNLKGGDNGLKVNMDGCDIKIKSNNFNEVISMYKKLQHDFSTTIISNDFHDESFNLLYLCEDALLKSTIQIVQDCFARYGPENIFISFNGGKDCTVLLHIILAVLKRNYPNYSQRPFCMYVQNVNPFPELNEFVENVSLYYNLNVFVVSSGIKEALQGVLNTHPNFKAVFLGTRKTDPFSQNLQHFQMTDENWPKIMRVNPLLDWDYKHIWSYLGNFGVPYCSLYDEGFTSLGNVNNTKRNPMLLYERNGDEYHLPAYKLYDGTKERLGRT